jgi:hypothetical protein
MNEEQSLGNRYKLGDFRSFKSTEIAFFIIRDLIDFFKVPGTRSSLFPVTITRTGLSGRFAG